MAAKPATFWFISRWRRIADLIWDWGDALEAGRASYPDIVLDLDLTSMTTQPLA